MGDTKKDTSQGIVTTGAAIARAGRRGDTAARDCEERRLREACRHAGESLSVNPHCLLHSEMLRLELTVDLIGEVIFVNRGVDSIVEAMREVSRTAVGATGCVTDERAVCKTSDQARQ
jgi:hypothetical protein